MGGWCCFLWRRAHELTHFNHTVIGRWCSPALPEQTRRSSLHSGPTSITGSSAGLLDPEAAGVALCFNAFALKTASAEVTGG